MRSVRHQVSHVIRSFLPNLMHAKSTDLSTVPRLQGLNGMYRRSWMEELWVRTWITLTLLGGVFGIAFALYAWANSQTNPGTVIIGIFGSAFLALGLYGYDRRIGVHFRIEFCRLSELGPKGAERWVEDLNGLASMSLWMHGGMVALRLRWPTHTRTIELPTSLYRAIYNRH